MIIVHSLLITQSINKQMYVADKAGTDVYIFLTNINNRLFDLG